MIFQINFFLYCIACSFMQSYLFVYAKHYANVTNAQFGVIAMILPALALVAKPASCSFTDARGNHKQFLIGSLIAFGLFYGSLGILPFFKDPADHDNDMLAWLIMCILFIGGYIAIACANSMNDALASNYARKNNLAYGRMRIWCNAGIASGAAIGMFTSNITWLPNRVPGCIILFVATAIDVLFLYFWPYDEDFEMFHDGSTVEQRKLSMVGPNTMAYLAKKGKRGSISRDMLEKIRTNRSKSVGNIPRMESSLTPINQAANFSNNKKEEKLPKEYSNFQCQMLLIKLIAKEHKSLMRYMLLFIVFGFVTGMVSTYQFDYLNAEIVKDPAEFEFIATLCLIFQSIVGEGLINLLVGQMLKVFGSNANMSMALVTLGMRCFFYGQLLPYIDARWVVLAEMLQGPSQGLYWVLIVEVGSNYALMVPDFMPELKRRGIVRNKAHEIELSGCLRASMIGIMSACQEGLGNGLGSFIGGLISSRFGYVWMWTFCASLAVGVGFLNIYYDLVTKLLLKRTKDKKNDQKRIDGIPTVVIDGIDIKL